MRLVSLVEIHTLGLAGRHEVCVATDLSAYAQFLECQRAAGKKVMLYALYAKKANTIICDTWLSRTDVA